MGFTTAQKEALEKVLATGASEVGTGPNRVKYRELTELRSLLAEMEADTGETATARQSLVEFGED